MISDVLFLYLINKSNRHKKALLTFLSVLSPFILQTELKAQAMVELNGTDPLSLNFDSIISGG